MSAKGIVNAGGGSAWGNIFTVQTPYLDNLGKQIYATEQNRQLQQQKESDLLDNQFSKELINIKKADIPEVSQAWDDYKQASIGLLKKGQHATPQDHYDLLEKKTNVFQKIGGSIEHKEFLKNQAESIKQKPTLYADNAQQQITTMLNTPTSQIDRSKDSDLLYPYAVPKLDKQIKDAQGKAAPVEIQLGQSKTDPLKDEKAVYTVGNDPNTFANKLLEGVMATNETRNFTGLMNNKYSDNSQLEDLKNRYTAKVNDPKFVAVFGQPKQLPATDTELGKAVAIRTMEEYANMDLTPKIVSTANEARVKANQKANSEQMQQERFSHQEKMAFLNNGLIKARADYNRAANTTDQDNVLNKFIDNTYDAGTTKLGDSDVKTVNVNGKSYTGKFVDVPKDVKQEFSIYQGKDPIKGDQWTSPDGYFVTDDKKTFIPVFRAGTKSSKGENLTSNTKALPIQSLKVPLAKSLLTKAKTGNEVTDNQYDAPPDVPQQPQQGSGTVRIQVNGKILEGSKENLNKLDKAGIKYKVIK